MSKQLPQEKLSLPREHVEAALRVLDVVARGIADHSRTCNPCMAILGDLWTMREIGQHAKAAARMLRKDLKCRSAP